MTSENLETRFAKALDAFLSNLQAASNNKMSSLDDSYKEYGTLLAEVVARIRGEGKGEFFSSFAVLQEEGHDIAGYLVTEIEVFNNVVRADADASSTQEESNRQLSAGQTIKDSIDGLLKLPGWLTKLLNILNELLSIIRGA